ncbi:hypothetical protein Tco_0381867 [Tanacetum coccineum]
MNLKKDAIHLILTGFGDEIFSTVDACQTLRKCGMPSRGYYKVNHSNIQDVKTKLILVIWSIHSHDGENNCVLLHKISKRLNEMIRNNLTVATIASNVQFLQQPQPDVRFVTIVMHTTQVG